MNEQSVRVSCTPPIISITSPNNHHHSYVSFMSAAAAICRVGVVSSRARQMGARVAGPPISRPEVLGTRIKKDEEPPRWKHKEARTGHTQQRWACCESIDSFFSPSFSFSVSLVFLYMHAPTPTNPTQPYPSLLGNGSRPFSHSPPSLPSPPTARAAALAASSFNFPSCSCWCGASLWISSSAKCAPICVGKWMGVVVVGCGGSVDVGLRVGMWLARAYSGGGALGRVGRLGHDRGRTVGHKVDKDGRCAVIHIVHPVAFPSTEPATLLYRANTRARALVAGARRWRR